VHQHLEAAVDHLLTTPDADVVICCATQVHAARVFDELGGAIAVRAPRGAGVNIQRGQLEALCGTARLRVQVTGHPVRGLRPSFVVDFGASLTCYEDLRRGLQSRHGHLLVAAVDHR
jgi:hypothetical protein